MINAPSIRRQRKTQVAQETVAMEWAQINDCEVVIVTKDNKWLHVIDEATGNDPFAETMSGLGSKVTTRQLLDAAFFAGVAAANPVAVGRRRSLPRYVREVIGFYCLTSATPPLLRELAVRFHEAGRTDLEKFALRF